MIGEKDRNFNAMIHAEYQQASRRRPPFQSMPLDRVGECAIQVMKHIAAAEKLGSDSPWGSNTLRIR
jgi:hypothetical protein